MNLDEAVKDACAESTLVEALSKIAIWECGRVVEQARRFDETGVSTAGHGGAYDTCFRLCFQRVMDEWSKR